MYALSILIVLIIILLWRSRETFASRREKATAIVGAFSQPLTYVEYRAKVPDSDIVEYELARKLQKNQDLSAEKLASLIR